MKKLFLLPWILMMSAGCVVENRRPIEITSISQSQPLGQEKSLYSNIRLDVGALEISAGDSSAPLYSYEVAYDKNSFAPDAYYILPSGDTEGRLSFHFHSTRTPGGGQKNEINKLHLAFNNSVPLNLDVTAGVGELRFSLSGLSLSRLDLKAGVGGAKLTSYEPNPILCDHIRLTSGVGEMEAIGLGNLNFRQLEFAGGVGSADLDFSGDWKQSADIEIRVGVGEVKMRMPREIGVRVDSAKNFLSGVHLEGFRQSNSSYYSENYERAAIKASIRVTTGIGGLKVLWI